MDELFSLPLKRYFPLPLLPPHTPWCKTGHWEANQTLHWVFKMVPWRCKSNIFFLSRLIKGKWFFVFYIFHYFVLTVHKFKWYIVCWKFCAVLGVNPLHFFFLFICTVVCVVSQGVYWLCCSECLLSSSCFILSQKSLTTMNEYVRIDVSGWSTFLSLFHKDGWRVKVFISFS